MTFKEEQKFRRWDILILLGALTLGAIYRLLDVTLIHEGSTAAFYLSILAIMLLSGSLLLLLSFRLRTKIDEKGIRVQFLPWQYRKRKIYWEEIKNIEVVETSLSTNLSGLTVAIGRPEWTYSFYGRTGLQVELNDGECFFIGTRHPKKMKEAVDTLKNKALG